MTCCFICQAAFDGMGNDPWPIPGYEKRTNRCCDACNVTIVGPARLRNAKHPSSPDIEESMQKLMQERRRVDFHIGILQREMAKVGAAGD